MKIWKVILATLVIFAAGAVTGALFIKKSTPPPVPQKPAERVPSPIIVQQRFLERLDKELQLSPDQRSHLEKVFAESRERMKILWDLIGPEMDAELREVRDKIRSELRPEQRARFEELVKQRPHHNPGGERSRGPRGSDSTTLRTNSIHR